MPHTLFGMLDSMNEGTWQFLVFSFIRQSTRSWVMIKTLFLNWIIVKETVQN